MKYAKKYKLVPYTNETPSASQLIPTFNNALTTDKFPDEKVKIYHQALSKIKDLNPTNLSAIESKNYEEDDEIPGESAEDRNARIAKEIDKLQKSASAYTASKTVRDYSNSDLLKTKKFKEKSKFDNEKFMTLLDDLVKNNITVTTRLQDIYNLIHSKVPLLSNTGYEWDSHIPGKTPAPAVRVQLKPQNETTVKSEQDENMDLRFLCGDNESHDNDDDISLQSLYQKQKNSRNNTLNASNDLESNARNYYN
jgi:hypothetical protein